MPAPLLLLLLLLLSAAAARPSPGDTAASLCAGARFPALCIRTLSRSAPSTPATLAISSLSASLSRTHSALSTLHHLPSPPSRSPLRDCLQQLSDSADQLSKSKAELDGIKEKDDDDDDVRMEIDDVCTWVSAALTNEDTCLEGMRKVEGGEEVEEVRRKVREVERLTSNALYFVAKLAPPSPGKY